MGGAVVLSMPKWVEGELGTAIHVAVEIPHPKEKAR